MKKIFVILSLCLALPMVGQAQSAHWAVSPSYQSITRFSDNLFKVKTSASTGICDENEKWVVSLAMDSITNLTNGFALAMTKKKDLYKIEYIIRENGTRETVKEDVYAGDYPYFVEDRCVVMNKKGKYGYLDPSGKLAVPCTYTAVLPFHNGVAHVSKAKGGFSGLLDKLKSGSRKSGTLYEVGKDGKIVKGSKDGTYLEIDKTGKVLRSVETVQGKIDTKNINQPYKSTPDPSYTRFTENKLYGYKKGGSVALPAQFEEGERVSDGYAIVMVDHLFGVVKFNTASVGCKVSETGGKMKAEATIPSVWENKAASIIRVVNDASRKTYEMQGTDTQRTLVADVSNEKGKKVYELACEKLILWRSYTKSTKSEDVGDAGKASAGGGITVSAPSTVSANAKNICAVNIHVVNRGNTTRTISLSLSTGQSSSIKLAAGKSGNVTVNVPVTKDTKCKITASGGGATSSCSTTLKAKFVL
ncbi:MAG: WG repeat-containing protein [Prevotella sp.]|nr:WG repeat-containing protein [Prevotella sp.]